MLKIDHLSYSSISAYMTCGKAWKYKYVDEIPTKPSETLVIGSCVHDTVEEIVKCNSLGIDAPDVAEFATQCVTERFENNEGINNTLDFETVKNETLRLVSASAIRSGIDMLKARLDNDGRPMIERKVELWVPGVDVPIVGYIDIVLADGTPADFKTSSRSWTQDKAQSELQPVFYLGAMTQCEMEVNWKFRHIVMVKNKTPKFQIIEHAHKPIEVFKLFGNIHDIWNTMSKGVFLPAVPGSWKCSPKYCDYYDMCQNN